MNPCQIAEAASLMRTEKAEAVAHRFSISRATLFRHLASVKGNRLQDARREQVH